MREIYLDNAATTRVCEEAAETAVRLMREEYGNPSSLHSKGLEAERKLTEARGRLAQTLGCDKGELIFTSGGTEANNLAIFGAANTLKRRGRTIVTTMVEHSSVLEPLRRLESEGWTIKRAAPDSDGHIRPDTLLELVDEDTVLISCMLVNSETGAVHPLKDISAGLKRKKSAALLHCDAVQAFGKLPFNVRSLGVDMATVSGHKIHAPKGCGALYLRKGVRVSPLICGGGQEKGLRSGTESAPLIGAFGVAADIARGLIQKNYDNMVTLRDYFTQKAANVDGLCINSPADGTPYICNISLPGYRSEIMLHYMAERGIYLSSGSACSRGGKSHVLSAMGLPERVIDSALRISFCRDNKTEDIDAFFDAVEGIRRDIKKK